MNGAPLAEGGGDDPPRDDTEAMLADIWRLVLGLERVGIHDRFVELGGDSLRAAEVAIAVEQRLGVPLTHSALADSPTIATLAARLRDAGAHPAPRALIPIRVAGTRPPLFAVHELESDAFLFSPLARRLGPDQPVYGLRLPAGEPVARLPATLTELADRYLDAIAEVRPRGPYHLAGFCFGGTVALEMARRLRERGQRVALLALLNVTAYDLMAVVSPAARRRFRGRLGARLRYLARKPDAVRWVSRRLAAMIADTGAAWLLRSGLARTPAETPAAPWRLRAALRDAFRRHAARPHEGDLTLFLADETLPLYADDPHEAWSGLARGRLTLHRLPHDGYAMLSEPDVAVVADALREVLGSTG